MTALAAGVRNEEDAGRYVLGTGGEQAFAAYTLDGDTVTYTHTVVPEDQQGHGVGSNLIAAALADVRAKGLRIVPRCPFVAAYIERHPKERDLLAR